MRALAFAPLMLIATGAMAQTECWVKREDVGASEKAHAPMVKILLAAEALVAGNKAFLATPVPTRNQASISAGHWGGHLWIAAYPEKTPYAQVWTKPGCSIYAAASTIGAGIGQVGIFFNNHVQEQFLMGHAVPRLERKVGPYPVYNGWIVMTRDGRLPWIAQTLADRLEREETARAKKLAEWRSSQASMKLPDAAALEKSALLMRKTDPAAADKLLATMRDNAAELRRLQQEVYPALGRQLEQAVAEVRRVRATFSPAQLAAPATWTDPHNKARQQLDARIRTVRALSSTDQQAVEALAREAKPLAAQLNLAQRAADKAEVERLRAALAALTARSRAISGQHMEKAGLVIASMADAFELEHLQPGDGSNVLAYKPDPAFPDRNNIHRIELITVRFAPKGQAEGRGPWMKAVEDSFDFASLAAMLK